MKVRTKPYILIVDDDERLSKLLAIHLKSTGFLVDTAPDAMTGYELATQREYDVIVLDMMMPKVNGLELCGNLRSAGVLTPILFLSGRTDKQIIVEGLNQGADDYLTKPFSQSELGARLKAMVRRNKKNFPTIKAYKYGIELDVTSYVVNVGTQSAQLTKKETLLLHKLMSEAPQPVQRNVLLRDVWGIDETHTSNRLDVYVRRLRAKLKYISGNEYIQTLRGQGYFLSGKQP